jgi:hypothetical protein
MFTPNKAKSISDQLESAWNRVLNLEEQVLKGKPEPAPDAKKNPRSSQPRTKSGTPEVALEAANSELELLLSAATTQDQRSRYSRSPVGQSGASSSQRSQGQGLTADNHTPEQEWHSDFLLVFRESEPNRPKKDHFELAKEAIELIGSTRLGRVQRAFSEEASVVLPRKMVQSLGAKLIQGQLRDLDEYPLNGILLSPDRIPNGLVQALGLVAWKPRTTQLQALTQKNVPAVIDGVKLALESLRRMNPKNSRIWIMNPNLVSSERYPQAGSIHSAAQGTLIYFSGDSATQPRPDATKQIQKSRKEHWFHREIPSHFTSVYALYRATLNKSVSYRKESDALSAFAQSARDLNLSLSQNWRKDAPPDLKLQMKNELGSLIVQATTILKGVRDTAKSEALSRLADINVQLDTEPRDPNAVVRNILTLLSRLVSVRNRINERRLDIPSKNKWNKVDSDNLEACIREQEQVFIDLHTSLNRAPEIVKQHSVFFDPKTSLTETQHRKEADVILKSLNIHEGRLAVVTVRPLLTFARAMTGVMVELKEAVEARNLPGTEQAVVKLVVISKLEQANACIERLKRFTIHGNVEFSRFEEVCSELLNVLRKREVFVNRRVADYQVQYEPIQKCFSAMAKRFGVLSKGPENAGKPADLHQKIRDFLDKPERDVESIVARLVGIDLASGDSDLDQGFPGQNLERKD